MRSLSEHPGRLQLACAGLVALICAVSVADYHRSTDRVPELPAPCAGNAAGSPCNEARNAEIQDRREEVDEAEGDLEWRLFLYAAVIFAIGIGYLVLRLRGLDPDEKGAAFTDLGVGAVVLLAVALILYAVHADGTPSFEYDPVPLITAAAALMVVAAFGSLAHWRRPEGGLGEAAADLPVAIKAGAISMVLAVAVSTIAASSRGDCADPRPEWLDTAFGFALAFALGAVAAGFIALLMRRWFASVLLAGIAPIWVFIAALASGCLS